MTVAPGIAYMMQFDETEGRHDHPRSTTAALEMLRKVYPDACPNDGFMHQLDVSSGTNDGRNRNLQKEEKKAYR